MVVESRGPHSGRKLASTGRWTIKTDSPQVTVLCRATQYACMLLSYVLEHKTGREEVIMKLRDLEASMRSGRKLFRLGNMLHAFVSARHASQLPDLVPRCCLTASNFNRVLYFMCDTVLWVKSVGLISDINKKKWRSRATKYYYYSLLINLANDLYELCWRMEQAARKGELQGDSSRLQGLTSLATSGLQPFLLLLYITLKKHPPLLLDTVKNLCDLSSPLDLLGIYKTNPGIIGFCGLISSLVGILTIAVPQLRLKY